MKNNILLSFLGILIFLSSVTYSQTDSVRTYTIKGVKLEIGKYYEIKINEYKISKGKLLAVNRTSFLFLIDNDVEEIDSDNIIDIHSILPENIIYTTEKRNKIIPVYSLSGGFSQKNVGADNGTSQKLKGFNVLGDGILKTSDNFGFRFDLNYVHIFGNTFPNSYSYYSSYDNSYNSSAYEYKDMNIVTTKTGICFGSMDKSLDLNFYIYLGFGFGWVFKESDISYYYKTINNVTTVTQYSYNGGSNFLIGAHTQIRASYKVTKKYAIFVEPSFQYWSSDVYGLFNINGGISFIL
jgi:hypothetical protein